MQIRSIPVGMLLTNCYILKDDKTDIAAVIDPGGKAEKILAEIDEMRADVKYIIFTHGHYDHILAAHAIQQATGAEILIHELDSEYLKKDFVTTFGKYTTASYIEVTPDRLLKDGDKIELGSLTLDVINTPGHTNGSICLLCEDVMFSGDTLFKGTCGRCDLTGGDINKMYQSLKRLAELPGNYRVLPGHESATTLDYERQANEYMREAMEK